MLVRDPRKLGGHRVKVQIALGDLADPYPIRNAMRGVETIIHLAATIRDQPRGTIEELNGLATARLLRSAERAGVERFVFFSAIGATGFQRTRFFRSKAIAEEAVREVPRSTRRSSRPRSSTAPAIRGSRCCSGSRSCRRCRSRAREGPVISRSGPGTSPAASPPRWTGVEGEGIGTAEPLGRALRARRSGGAHLRRDRRAGPRGERAEPAARPRPAAPGQGRPARRRAGGWPVSLRYLGGGGADGGLYDLRARDRRRGGCSASTRGPYRESSAPDLRGALFGVYGEKRPRAERPGGCRASREVARVMRALAC